jgi:hypothetical protein
MVTNARRRRLTVSHQGPQNLRLRDVLSILDGDMAQYTHDNPDAENSHVAFLKAYLESKGAEAVDLSAPSPRSQAVRRRDRRARHGSPTS